MTNLEQIREEIKGILLGVEGNAFEQSEGSGEIPIIKMDTFINQILEVIKKHTYLKAEREKIFKVGDRLLEMLYHADFSNGVEAFGIDEGRVRGYEMLKELEKDWQALKRYSPPTQKG